MFFVYYNKHSNAYNLWEDLRGKNIFIILKNTSLTIRITIKQKSFFFFFFFLYFYV